jgi:VanZ family protein
MNEIATPSPWRTSRILAPALWAVGLFALSSIPGGSPLLPHLFPGSDKIGHLGLYTIFGFLIARAGRWDWRNGRSARFWTLGVVGIAALYGASDEWHQSFVPNRSMSLEDWFCDVAGGAIGSIFWWVVLKKIVRIV